MPDEIEDRDLPFSDVPPNTSRRPPTWIQGAFEDAA